MIKFITKYYKKIIKFIKKYCYVSIPVITILLAISVYFFTKINLLLKCVDEITTLVSISGTLIGFLLTAMTIFFSLNKNQQYMQYFKKYNHHIIFGRLVITGIVFLFVNILSWLINFPKHIIIVTFILGLEETIMAAYYTYKLSLNSFK